MAKKPSGLGLFPGCFLPCKMVFQDRGSCWLRESAKHLFEVPRRLQIGNGKVVSIFPDVEAEDFATSMVTS